MKCLSGPRKAREAVKHFGAAGTPHSHAKPFVRYLFSVNDDVLDRCIYLSISSGPRDASSREPEAGGSPEDTRSRMSASVSLSLCVDTLNQLMQRALIKIKIFQMIETL